MDYILNVFDYFNTMTGNLMDISYSLLVVIVPPSQVQTHLPNAINPLTYFYVKGEFTASKAKWEKTKFQTFTLLVAMGLTGRMWMLRVQHNAQLTRNSRICDWISVPCIRPWQIQNTPAKKLGFDILKPQSKYDAAEIHWLTHIRRMQERNSLNQVMRDIHTERINNNQANSFTTRQRFGIRIIHSIF